MSKKNDKLINELENRFADYKNIQRNIVRQKAALKMERQQHGDDDNVGGGRGNSIGKPTEVEALLYVSDPYIQEQERDEKAIEATLLELGDIERELIERKYWGDCSWMTWKEFGKEVHYSPASMSRLKQKALMIFGRRINRIGKWN